jgi:hypothetical protein
MIGRMYASRRAAAAFALSAVLVAGRTARAKPRLAIVTSGATALPVEKIRAALEAQSPDLLFHIATVEDEREGIPRARIVSSSDGAIAVAYEDVWGREDVQILEPGPEPAAAIARTLLDLRASLDAEPAPEEEELEPDDADLEHDPYVERQRPRLARRARAARGSDADDRPTAGGLEAAFGFGAGHVDLGPDGAVTPTYVNLAGAFVLFPARLHDVGEPGGYFGLRIAGALGTDGLDYSRRQVDLQLVLELPLGPTRRSGAVRMRGGWGLIEESVNADRHEGHTEVSFDGMLVGADLGAPFGYSSTLWNVRLDLHAIRGNRQSFSGEADAGQGLGWTAGLGLRDQFGRLEWSVAVSLTRYSIEMGADPSASSVVQALVGVGYPL